MSTKTRKLLEVEMTPQVKERLRVYNQRWIEETLSCRPADWERSDAAVRELYVRASLPAPLVVVHTPSPLVAALAGTIAAGWWYLSENPAFALGLMRAATGAATWAATRAATRAATGAATWAATGAATEAATWAATRAATRAATEAATPPEVWALAQFMLSCCEHFGQMYNGGNQWAAWCSYLGAFRDLFGLELGEHAAYACYESAALAAGPRMMHPKFAMVSDRPERLITDLRNGVHVAHCEDGPSHRWRDGWSIWFIDGVQVDEQIVLRPETQTLAQIDAEPNSEVKRIRIQRYGWPRYLRETEARVIELRKNDIDQTLESLVESQDGRRHLICSCPSTAKLFAMGVPRRINTCAQAQAWLSGGSRLGPLRVIGAS